MKKIIRLTEDDLSRLVRKILKEEGLKTEKITLGDYFDDVYRYLKKKFDLTSRQVDEIVSYYRETIEMGFMDGDSVKSVVNSLFEDGELTWRK